MKVCTVLVSATSKRPIKLLSHADRQKSDDEGRTGKRPRAAPGFASARQLPAGGHGEGAGGTLRPGKGPSTQRPCPGRGRVFLLKPRARNTNQMCAEEGTQVMRGSPHPARPGNDRMQLLQPFPGCRLLPLQNKPGEDEGGAAAGKKGTI